MRRALTLLFLLVLPIQFCWAAAAAYCLHGTPGHETAHFGHHEHRHVEAPSSAGAHASGDAAHTDASQAEADLQASLLDDDCAFCHLGHLQAVGSVVAHVRAVTGQAVTDPPMQALTAPRPSRHERPNWQRA